MVPSHNITGPEMFICATWLHTIYKIIKHFYDIKTITKRLHIFIHN